MSWRNRSVQHRRGLWPLNEHADDMSGYGMHGTLVNAPTWVINQFGRQCIELDGDDAYVNLGDLTYLNAVSAFTIAFWMNQDVLDRIDNIFVKYLGGSDRVVMYTHTDGDIHCFIDASDATYDYSLSCSAGSWHHVAWVFDGAQTGDANRVQLYIDGAPVALTFSSGVPATTSSNLVGVDAHIGYTSLSFDGKLFDFQIFNAPLSRDEVAAVMRGHG